MRVIKLVLSRAAHRVKVQYAKVAECPHKALREPSIDARSASASRRDIFLVSGPGSTRPRFTSGYIGFLFAKFS